MSGVEEMAERIAQEEGMREAVKAGKQCIAAALQATRTLHPKQNL